MENLQQIFIDETTELLGVLGKSLLQLEHNAEDPDGISKVFRSMHTIKGSSGMFGYDAICDLTHELESIFEAIRGGTAQLTPEILHLTFRSIDHLESLLADPLLHNQQLGEQHQALMQEITAMAEENSSMQVTGAAENTSRTLFYVSVLPDEAMLRNGNNLLFLVDDLLALGTGVSFPHFGRIPELAQMQPDACYTGFEVLLETALPETAIHEVFIFVAGSSQIDVRVIGTGSNSTLRELQEKLAPLYSPVNRFGFETITAMAGLAKTVKPDEQQLVKSTGTNTQRKNKEGTSIRVSAERLDELMNLVSELVTTQAQLTLLSNRFPSGELETISENVEKITRRLRDNAFSMSLIPVESLVVRFQRLVRDLSKELNKDVVLVTEGTETEIDKSIIEKLTDPILHLLRNALDHGIETREERLRKNKPERGVISLKAYYSGAHVVIEISDDGNGIDLDKVRSKAISKGIISADAILSEKEIIQLIFTPGFSTAESVTGISGRGVGMDVVRKNIAEIRGEFEISTVRDAGTVYSIRLPLTLSIIDGLLVKIGNTDFILPLSSVYKCYEVETSVLEQAFNTWVTLDGERTPFVYLRDKFEITGDKPALSQVIKVLYRGNYVGLVFDRIAGEYQAVLKNLGSFYQGQDEFSGATILGDGTVALVIDPYRVISKTIGEAMATDMQELKTIAGSHHS